MEDKIEELRGKSLEVSGLRTKVGYEYDTVSSKMYLVARVIHELDIIKEDYLDFDMICTVMFNSLRVNKSILVEVKRYIDSNIESTTEFESFILDCVRMINRSKDESFDDNDIRTLFYFDDSGIEDTSIVYKLKRHLLSHFSDIVKLDEYYLEACIPVVFLLFLYRYESNNSSVSVAEVKKTSLLLDGVYSTSIVLGAELVHYLEECNSDSIDYEKAVYIIKTVFNCTDELIKRAEKDRKLWYDELSLEGSCGGPGWFSAVYSYISSRIGWNSEYLSTGCNGIYFVSIDKVIPVIVKYFNGIKLRDFKYLEYHLSTLVMLSVPSDIDGTAVI